MKLSEIAKMVNGEFKGEDVEISGVSDLDNQAAGTIAYAENKKNLEKLEASPVSAILIPVELECKSKPFIVSKDVKIAFAKILTIFNPYEKYEHKIYPDVYIGENTKPGKDITIMPYTVIMGDSEIGDGTIIYSHVFIGKNVKIGRNCIIKAGVAISDGTEIGNNVIIHPNSVIGGDGFGYVQKDRKNVKIPQIGRIVIGDDVEIGACVTIDRATIGETVIGSGTKIDNLVQIAHNVKIGENSIVVSQTGIAGSSRIGKNCILAGQVGIADHVEIQDNVILMARSGIESHQVVEKGSVLLGTPAKPFMEQKRIYAAEKRLPEMVKILSREKKASEKEE